MSKILVSFRATEQQKSSYIRAAAHAGLTYADFLKKACDDAVEKAFQNMMVERMKRLQRILDKAGLTIQEVPWPKVLDRMEFFPDEQLEILEKRSDEDIRNYFSFAMKTA